MRRISSQHAGIFVFLTLTTLLMSVAAFSQSQSLGDVARENREKKAADQSSSTAPRVITNATLPKAPDEDAGPVKNGSGSTPTQKRAWQVEAQHAAQQRANEQRAAAEWKRRILQQKNAVANLRMRVDRLKASIHFANVNTYNDMPFNRYQARQMERLAQLQQQLDDERRKLDDLQEAARHAGMHTLVYDP